MKVAWSHWGAAFSWKGEQTPVWHHPYYRVVRRLPCSTHTRTCKLQTGHAVVCYPRSLCISSLKCLVHFSILCFSCESMLLSTIILCKDQNKDYSSSENTSILMPLGKCNLATIVQAKRISTINAFGTLDTLH